MAPRISDPPSNTATAPKTAQIASPVMNEPPIQPTPWPIQTTPTATRTAPTMTRASIPPTVTTRPGWPGRHAGASR
jgi:hypothetical protein